MAENKIFAHTPEEVEALINKEGIEYVSVRFTDLIGVQQHFTVPASEFIDNAFTDGMPFDGSSVQGFQAINESYMKLIPAIEVHMSNIHGRDDFRHISVTASECLGQIAGMGKHSYKIAMEAFKQMIEEGQL